MEITCTDVAHALHHNGFGTTTGMWVAHVEFSGPELPETVYMSLSHRDDDPEGMWLADSRIDGSRPIFVHGAGDRTCNKQIAGDPILEAIMPVFAEAIKAL